MLSTEEIEILRLSAELAATKAKLEEISKNCISLSLHESRMEVADARLQKATDDMIALNAKLEEVDADADKWNNLAILRLKEIKQIQDSHARQVQLNDSLTAKLGSVEGLGNSMKEMIEHAIDLDHLGGGSTLRWAKDVIKAWEARGEK